MTDLTAPPPLATELHAKLARLRAGFDAEPMPPASVRQARLNRLKQTLLANRARLVEAVAADFGTRPAMETLFADLMPALHAIDHNLRHVRRWMRPQRRRPGWLYRPATAEVVYQPLGVVGIMVPWNYPILLAVSPLAGALAAGNRVMLKLSEFVPATSELMRALLTETFGPEEVDVVLGDAETSAAFARLPFDHLLFTGSTQVGREVMRAAADNLTPVTLELGGKCPVIVHGSYPLARAAERIAFGKALNAGQTCVSPDYVLCPREQVVPLALAIEARFKRRYPRAASNPDYTAIVNDRHYQRLQSMLADARALGATLRPLEAPAPAARKLPLTLLLDTTDEMRVRHEEIFGPLLPIIPYDHLDEALAYVRARPRPLALYYFDDDRDRQDRLLRNTHAGAVCMNDTLLQIAVDDLPFGGVGASGMGQYHGWEGFQTFSKAKGVLRRGRYSLLKTAYPPYRALTRRLLEWLMLR